MNAIQPSLIRDILHVPTDDDDGGAHGKGKTGTASGSIVVFAEITVMLTSVMWGTLTDRVSDVQC